MSRADCIVRSVLVPLAVYILIGLLGTAAESEYSIPGQLIEKLVTLAFCWGLILRDRQYFPAEKKKLPASFWILTAAAGILGSLGLNCLFAAAGMTGDASGSVQAVSSALAGSDSPAALALTAVTLIAVSPMAEEFLFRGLVFSGIRRCVRFVPAAVLSALIFALFHGNIGQGIFGFLMGLAFALVYEKSGSLAAPVIMHAAANALSAAAGLLPGMAEFTGRYSALFAAAGIAGWIFACAGAARAAEGKTGFHRGR